MDWVDGDKAKIEAYLGLVDQSDLDALYISMIQARVGPGSDFTVENYQYYLHRIAEISLSLDQATTIHAGIKTDGTTEYFEGEPFTSLRREGKRYCDLLAHGLGLTPRIDYFENVLALTGPAGPTGPT